MPLMCNNEVECLEELTIDFDQQLHQADFVAMDDSHRTNLIDDEDIPQAKFLCSFGGCISPRPQDGKLRYVGGETRIVSVPRNIGYEELMARMRELYEGASILKYQQPDEDLDALVSVVNDDDVINMMEEYDKLESGEGVTRLRIFLFSHLDQDASPHYMEGDERDTERRYVDALNSLSESSDYNRQNLADFPLTTPFDEIRIADQFFNSMNLDGSVHNQRNYEMVVPPYNLGQLANPSIAASQHSLPLGQLHEEAPWSPAVYSPRYAGPREMRTYTELAPPPSARLPVAYQEMTDKCTGRMAEESNHQQVNSQIPFDHQQPYSDQVVWLPTGTVPVDRSGFPGNMLNEPSVVDCPSVCHNCKTTFQMAHSFSDFHRKPEEHGYVEQSTMGNGFTKVASPCVECVPRAAQISAVGMMGDQCLLDAPSTKVPIGLGNLVDGSIVPTTYASTTTYALHGTELGGEVFHGQAMPNGSHVHVPLEEQGSRTTNLPYLSGPDIPYQVSHGNTSVLATRWHPPAPLHVCSHDPSILQPRNSIPSAVAHTPWSVVEGNSTPSSVVHTPRSVVEGSPRFFIGVDQNPWVESPHKRLGGDGSTVPEHPYGHVAKFSPYAPFQEIQQTFAQDPLRNAPGMLMVPPSVEAPRSSELPAVTTNDNSLSSNAGGHGQLQRQDTCNIEVTLNCTATELTNSREAEILNIDDICPSEQNNKAERSSAKTSLNADKSNSRNPAEGSVESMGETKTSSLTKNGDLTSLPERIASAKREKIGVEEVKGEAQGNCDAIILRDPSGDVTNVDETELLDVEHNSEGGSENKCGEADKIERTKAEEEAIAKGLQTIKYADLEEVRELGSGTYGAVYHGKWKGSDVAIKRIKASCFAGRPSERERLIADFWKEALILSSLHHPNVVSFYGIVRDGPDGSLATVTEFMVNGSLKQYLRKKDRTIDRRKRLIIAMDAAFGMEYLHEKNIVHFDLKCENLLVNMRDPHRPVCKIGDLGLSKVKQHTLVSGGVRGTLPWMAPELLSGESHMVTEKIDVYSFGIVMWELLTGEEPYSDIHCASLIGGIVNNTLRPQIPTWCDPEWKALMESCWASDPAERPSFSEISQKLRTMAAAMNVK